MSLKGCATCVQLLRKCDGECESCGNGIEKADGSVSCKCFECYDEDTGLYDNYKASATLLGLFEGE